MEHLMNMKKPNGLDAWGVTPRALWIIAKVAPQFIQDVYAKLCCSPAEWKTFSFYGYAKAKKPGAVPAEKVRVINQLPVVVRVVDAELAGMLNGLTEWAEQGLNAGFYEAARKKRQVLDVIFASRLATERGLDAKSQVSIGQADLHKYYDSLCPIRVARYCESLVVGGPIAAEQIGCSQVDVSVTLICMHCLPRIVLRVGQEEAIMAGKGLGMLTGSASAAASGRIPPMELALSRMGSWQASGLGLTISPDHPPLCLMTFVDNFLVLGPSAEANSILLADAERHLKQTWGLKYGSGSTETMPCVGSKAPQPADKGKWPVRTHFRSLGCILQNNGRCNLDIADAFGKAHACVLVNLGKGLLKAGRSAKRRFLVQSVRSTLSWKWGAWTHLKATSASLDCLQRCLIALMWQIRPLEGEGMVDFFSRQRRDTGLIADELGWWSEDWARSVVGWHNHTIRNKAGAWGLPISRWKNQSWVEAQRKSFADRFASLSQWGITRTSSRAVRGSPPTRWKDGCKTAADIVVPFGYEGLLEDEAV